MNIRQSIALLLLSQVARGQPARHSGLRENPLSDTKCEDGTDCTSPTCLKAVANEQNKETCDAPILIPAATRAAMSPQGKSFLVESTGPFCVKFNDPPDTEGFAPCPGVFDNIDVLPSTGISPSYGDDPVNPLSGDNYLHVKDKSGGSLACGTGADYTGDWTSFASSKCHDLCFDAKLFRDGCHSGVATCSLNADGTGYFIDIYPYIMLQGGPPNYYRAVFKAYDFMTDEDGSSPEWRRICAPLAPLNDAGELPSNADGYWYMATPNDILSGSSPVAGPASPNSAWPDLLSDVTAIQLPIDFTGNPAERAGYDNICMVEKDCEDDCDPEPLCYWQHEWDCKDAKKEEWYGNFTELISPLQTFPKKFCLCKLLEECCADLCDIAEQEFAALLLNVASGKLSLDCGVEECDDCLHNVSSVISMVDMLLAPSSRSDYDCSKALQYLTGINHDEILCDSVDPIPEPCPQTEECAVNKGTCVETPLCIPSDTVSCEGHFCGDGTGEKCTCKMEIPCPQTTKCEDKGGKCIKICQEGPGVQCKDFCSTDDTVSDADKCMCEIKDPPCVQTTLCTSNGGECVKEEDCGPPFHCNANLCDLSEGCVCKIADDFPCVPTSNACAENKGECVKNCVPIDNVRKCVPEWCSADPTGDLDDVCSCKIERCEDENNVCQDEKGGACKPFDDCDPAVSVCDPDLCGNGDLCVCEYSTIPLKRWYH
mmetsp:Transcript_11103/g.23697  ORF Transcript_11103/g.23697 Transcript_11103/m.23697 type:complete len:711 (+) Transcript_11103:134-2266(+)